MDEQNGTDGARLMQSYERLPLLSSTLRSTAHPHDELGTLCCRICQCCRSLGSQDQYKALGEHVHAVQSEVMAEQLATFKRSLEEFAIKHR